MYSWSSGRHLNFVSQTCRLRVKTHVFALVSVVSRFPEEEVLQTKISTYAITFRRISFRTVDIKKLTKQHTAIWQASFKSLPRSHVNKITGALICKVRSDWSHKSMFTIRTPTQKTSRKSLSPIQQQIAHSFTPSQTKLFLRLRRPCGLGWGTKIASSFLHARKARKNRNCRKSRQ